MVSSGTKTLVRGWTSLTDVTVADISPAHNTAAPAEDVVVAEDIFASWFNGILLEALWQKYQKNTEMQVYTYKK